MPARDVNIKLLSGIKGQAELSGMRESKNVKSEAGQGKRNAILAALSKAGGEATTSSSSAAEPDEDNNGYYTLTKDEVTALVKGNIEKVEGWVGNLDRHHATRLLRWLIKEGG
jgi:hypothetical protein